MINFSEAHPAPGAYLTPDFVDLAREAGVMHIEHRPDDIAALGVFMQSEAGRGLPAKPYAMDFVYRTPDQDDLRYNTAAPYRIYRNAGPDTTPLDRPVRKIEDVCQKIVLERRGTTVVEIEAGDLNHPLSADLAHALLIPPRGSEEAQSKARLSAWGKQILNALTNPDTNQGNPELEAEAARRFPNAIILRRDK